MNDSVACTRNFEVRILNTTLYAALQRHFRNVVIAKEGCPLVGGGYVADGLRTKFVATEMGEYYRVDCPWCGDSRQRLWINHRWGVGLDENHPMYDPADRFWWASTCYNEGCLKNPERVAQLRTWIYGGLGRELHRREIPVSSGMSAPAALQHVELPGTCIPLRQLSAHHVANAYLATRGFDPLQLDADYGLCYCDAAPPEYPTTNGRLIIPICMNGDRVGWQARAVYDCDFAAMHCPKYYNLPGMNKSAVLYGLDQAVGTAFCTIVEGVSDVWAIGPGALATLGKTLSYVQAEMIVARWPVAVIAYDADAPEYVERAKVLLESKLAVVPVTLPDGLDPATTAPARFWDIVYQSAEKVGVTLP